MRPDEYDPWHTPVPHDPWAEDPGRSDTWLVDGHGRDTRLIVQAWVDGRMVESRTGSVDGTRWQRWADDFDRATRWTPPPEPPRTPEHARVLAWLDAVAGGREALVALVDDPVPPPPALPEALTEAVAEVVAEVGEHLDRICADYFGDGFRAACQHAVVCLLGRRQQAPRGLAANEVAAGVLWNVARANNSFTGGVTHQLVKRELWVHKQLSTYGQRMQDDLKGVLLTPTPRPYQCPKLEPYANLDLLTPTTRRLVMRWRDAALSDAARAVGGVLPLEVES